jgi:DNA-binding beta-propeller fold protein YncE
VLIIFSIFLEAMFRMLIIYHTNPTTNTLSCHKINGDKLWEFKDVAIIRSPGGVAVDKDLNVYLASFDDNSVVVISPDGKRSRTLLGKSEGIYNPSAKALLV